jgi:hypothetical protein
VHKFSPSPLSHFQAALGLLAQNNLDLTPQKECQFKKSEKYVMHGNYLSFIFLFRRFIKKRSFIPVKHGFLSPI